MIGFTAYNIPSPPIMGGADREGDLPRHYSGGNPIVKGRRTPLMAHSRPFPTITLGGEACKMNLAFPPMGGKPSIPA